MQAPVNETDPPLRELIERGYTVVTAGARQAAMGEASIAVVRDVVILTPMPPATPTPPLSVPACSCVAS